MIYLFIQRKKEMYMKKKLLAGLVLSTLVLTAFSACVKKKGSKTD